MKHDMEQGMRYIVTKDSNDGTFVVGDKVELLHDNAVGNWTVGGWIDAVDVPEATAGMEVEIDIVWLNRKKDVLQKQLDQLNRKVQDAK
ncbi:hypothetical protein [Candidatus Accumulibacter vicinus]|uniref:Uncharacterized protein n=1 Tax=Candidatus Accumulibacter vicinus TaxID=2954382 RepID=A0A084XW38_9PROT|nr:hypothetical protein [Candidatus Accumulibacter vicinus]KFB66682.1 MAG: hypothetical protein CAPSK01_003946 [Candidatus Accumulibacter vicinus]